MAYFIHSFVNRIRDIPTHFLVKSKYKAPIKNIAKRAMDDETVIERVEHKIDTHIDKHNEDYKRLLWWIIGSLIGVMASTAAWFVSMGSMQEKVFQLESDTKDKITRQEFLSFVELMNVKFTNINEKLDDIKDALNVK